MIMGIYNLLIINHFLFYSSAQRITNPLMPLLTLNEIILNAQVSDALKVPL